MSTDEKETVVVVHGTWAAPAAGVSKWWQPPETKSEDHFTAKLDAALAKRGSTARCWAHCAGKPQPFSWTGENDWLDRTNASASLLSYFKQLEDDGYRYHVVAHSHGGNAIADALHALDPKTAKLGRIVTLGTPFFDTQQPIRQRKLKVEKAVSLISILVAAAAALFALSNGFHFAKSAGYLDRLPGQLAFLALVLVIALVLGDILRKVRAIRASSSAASSPEPPIGLSISSPYDEVRQVLNHLRKLPNPLAVSQSLPSYLRANYGQSVEQKAQISRIHGAVAFGDITWFQRRLLLLLYSVVVFIPAFAFLLTQSQQPDADRVAFFFKIAGLIFLGNIFYVFIISAYAGPKFYSAFLTPFRWIGNRLASLASLPGNVVTFLVRNQAWAELQTHAMGLHGYAFTLPTVETTPTSDPRWRFVEEELSEAATQRALQRRDLWLNKRVGDVSRALSALTLTASDIEVLLKDIAQDMTLVHAAYYTDDECIERIADWISGAGQSSLNPPTG